MTSTPDTSRGYAGGKKSSEVNVDFSSRKRSIAKFSSPEFTPSEKEIQNAYRTPRKKRRRSNVISLTAKKKASVSSSIEKKCKYNGSVKLSPDVINSVFENHPLPAAESDSWTHYDDDLLRQALLKYYSSGAFGKCDWSKVFEALNGRHRRLTLQSRWSRLFAEYEKGQTQAERKNNMISY